MQAGEDFPKVRSRVTRREGYPRGDRPRREVGGLSGLGGAPWGKGGLVSGFLVPDGAFGPCVVAYPEGRSPFRLARTAPAQGPPSCREEAVAERSRLLRELGEKKG